MWMWRALQDMVPQPLKPRRCW
ncbi:hypothetical protein E2C01_052023 [Portunus trituberculatus]|uniref:Uncharacterized protein n=1 Tax=Portunus trituberculatus TaxID=210409 RepID=A0A5B7GCI7_PORTR|nr:hypothetical protein [Portunus trituberculatus]